MKIGSDFFVKSIFRFENSVFPDLSRILEIEMKIKFDFLEVEFSSSELVGLDFFDLSTFQPHFSTFEKFDFHEALFSFRSRKFEFWIQIDFLRIPSKTSIFRFFEQKWSDSIFSSRKSPKSQKFSKNSIFWAKFSKLNFWRDPFLDGSVTVITGNPWRNDKSAFVESYFNDRNIWRWIRPDNNRLIIISKNKRLCKVVLRSIQGQKVYPES